MPLSFAQTIECFSVGLFRVPLAVDASPSDIQATTSGALALPDEAAEDQAHPFLSPPVAALRIRDARAPMEGHGVGELPR